MRKAPPTENNIQTFRHQQQIVQGPHLYPELEWFILAGGYGCGKSFSIVLCILDIVKTYNGQEISVGIGSITITLAKKTIWKDLSAILKRSKSKYTFNKQDNTLIIGTITFFFIAIEQPEDIYAYNVNIFLCDEIDELSQSKVLDANKAIRERTRIMLPNGRNPYIMYFTTVQGYRGLYNVMQELKRAKQKYMLVRGLTKDNTTLARSYVDSLYAIYDENERMAYLEGRFVNLRAGRVYPDYDDSECMCKPFEIGAEYTVMIGQDLNSGFSKGVAVIKKDKRLYIVRGWSFAEIGQAPSIMRSTFAENEILWFPDSAGKEIVKGYKQEIIDYGIECRIGRSNPRIIDRVFYVNKLFRLGLLKMFDCPETHELSEALKTRQYDDSGKPEKGKGEKSPDHFCDALEYVLYRIVNSDSDFMELKELSRENIKKNGHLQID
jgi:hypothetical protein